MSWGDFFFFFNFLKVSKYFHVKYLMMQQFNSLKDNLKREKQYLILFHGRWKRDYFMLSIHTDILHLYPLPFLTLKMRWKIDRKNNFAWHITTLSLKTFKRETKKHPSLRKGHENPISFFPDTTHTIQEILI